MDSDEVHHETDAIGQVREPEEGTVAPEAVLKAPEVTSEALEKVTEAPEEATEAPEEATEVPEEATETTEKVVATPGDAETETSKLAHDSMVTVRLSEPTDLELAVTDSTNSIDAPIAETIEEESDNGMSERQSMPDDDSASAPPTSSNTLSSSEANGSLEYELGECNKHDNDISSSDDEEVNWEQLEKTEDEQTKDEDTDNSTAMLLARLEQENAKLATNPKSVKVQAGETSNASKPRPPSMAQLRKMVSGPTPSALRYSMLPPPPMTDLEFFAAIVKDYQQTAARLPTLLSNKIRKGIPPPLRGVVWQSMSGGRDATLEEQYERFCGESSPYELIIGKDLGRSFPGVEMFRDPDGDGQRMLGRVLRAFSLHDTKIGYCQGLAFLVGPLLMHMPDKQAFCVLVRLMEHYDLRGCFLPDLSGLHVRIYQFRELLRLSLPALATHLEDLQVDPAYVSQWFLSFFAVTCPLPMLFRIYDVVFAEGASETLMRVGLSLMRKNEPRLLACTELEDVMQLLLSRSLWDCYHYNADEFVDDFVSLTSVVTRETLAQLEQGYRQSQIATANVARSSAITTAATRFLGRIWASSSTSTPPKVAALSPGLSAPSRPLSMLRHSTSKQSLASTLNSMEASSASVASSTSTDVTTVSRDSSNTEEDSLSRESTPVGTKSFASSKNTDERYLHSQIEDLLTALSELQRDQALLSDQLQRELGERDEDRKVVRALLDGLRRKATTELVPTEKDKATSESGESADNDDESDDDKTVKRTSVSKDEEQARNEEQGEAPSTEDLSVLLDAVEGRFRGQDEKRRSSMLQSKTQLREELLTAKEQLTSAVTYSQELSRRVHEQDQEMTTLRDQLRDSHSHGRALYQDKQRLEKQVHSLKVRASACSAVEPASRDMDMDWGSKGPLGGLREFKLGRSKSTPSQAGGFSKRMSSLPQNLPQVTGGTEAGSAPAGDQDVLVMELIQAKTSEAIAKQEAEEARQKLETMRKFYGLPPGDSPSAAAATPPATMTVFGRLTGQGGWQSPEHTSSSSGSGTVKQPAASTTTPAAPVSGGFWSWRR